MKLYDSIKTGLKVGVLSLAMAYSLSSCDNNNYMPLQDQVASTLVKQQSLKAQEKIDSLKTIALKDIDSANKVFNKAVLNKNVSQEDLELMDSLYSQSKKEYSLIENIAEKYDIKKYPEIDSQTNSFSKDLSDILNGYDYGKSAIKKKLEKKGIKDVKVYNPKRNESSPYVVPSFLLFLLTIAVGIEKNSRKRRYII